MTQRDFLAFAQRVKSAGISFSEARQKFEKALAACLVGQKQREADKGFIDGVKTFPDGREVVTPAVMRERTRIAHERDGGVCGICNRYVYLSWATPDHINPRGMGGGRRDDRQENIRAVHALCNSDKGSKRNYRP